MTTRTKEELLALAEMDPELVEALKTAQSPKFDFSEPEKLVKLIRGMMASRPTLGPDPAVVESQITLPARDGYQLRLLIFSPASATSGPPPLFVMYHGGGGALGRPEDTTIVCRGVVKHVGAICVAPEYRRAPEHKFPTGVNDAWDALQWLGQNAEKTTGGLNLAQPPSLSKGFVLGGVSNGGNLCGALSHLARDTPSFTTPLTGVYFAAASFCSPEALPADFKYADRYLSRTQPDCMDAPGLNRDMKSLFTKCLEADPHSPLFASLLWPTGHTGLPKTYFQVCGMDINRDEALIYEQILREEAGVKTRLDLYPGVPHIFWGAFPTLSQSHKWFKDTMEGVAWLVGQGVRL